MSIEELKKELQHRLNLDNVDNFFDYLAKFKGRKLTETEQSYLCLWLCGFSYTEITITTTEFRKPTLEELSKPDNLIKKKTENTTKPAILKVTSYLKSMMGVERIPSHNQVYDFLQEQGFITVKKEENPEKVTNFMMMLEGLEQSKAEQIVKYIKDQYNINITLMQSIKLQ